MIDYTKLKRKINPVPDGEDRLILRVGTVSAINSNGTVDVIVSDVVQPGVPVLAGASFAVASTVQIISYRGSMLVLGKTGGEGADRIASGGITADTTVTNGEQVKITPVPLAGGTPVWRAGRVYRAVFTGNAATSATANSPLLRFRKTDTSGQQLDVWRVAPTVTGTGGSVNATHTSWFKVLGSDVTADIVLTLGIATSTATLTASSTGQAIVNIYEDGIATSALTHIPTLT